MRIKVAKFVKLGIKNNAVNITPKTDPIVLMNNTKPDFESLLWSSLYLIIEMSRGFMADITTKGIDSKIKLPRNSQISVQSEGILGNKYLSIIPGDDSKQYIFNNGFFENVRDYESIEDQVSKIIFLATQ